jgi:predicted  nucleic acid-binding Zn-ribbon protein
MDNKILEILLDMQKEIKDMKSEMKDMKSEIKDMKSEMKDMKSEMKDINTKIDRLEYKMTDGFETLELLTENNTNELNKVKIKVSKLEKRVAEFNTVN